MTWLSGDIWNIQTYIFYISVMNITFTSTDPINLATSAMYLMVNNRSTIPQCTHIYVRSYLGHFSNIASNASFEISLFPILSLIYVQPMYVFPTDVRVFH